jgi:hypothetical protein
MLQPPLPLHVEAVSQTPGVQVYAEPPQVPFVQTSLDVQLTPSLHAVPLVTLAYDDVLTPG